MKPDIIPRLSFPRLGKLLILFAILPLSLISQPTTINVNPPTGGFKIDGQLRVNSAVGDWWESNINPLPSTYTGGYIFPPTQKTDSKIWIEEKWNSTSDEIFTEGSKFNGDPGGYVWANSKPTSKNDIHNGLFYITTSPEHNDRWLFLAGDRLSIKGTSYIDFEFLQNTVTMNSDHSFTTEGPDGGRTVGDFVISMEYANGGDYAHIHVYYWKEDPVGSGNYKYVEELNLPEGTAFAETNRSGPVDAPYPNGAFGSSTYEQYAFVEAAINITHILGVTNSCDQITIKTIFIKTKASDAPEAALKDFIAPQSVNLVFGGATITYNSPYCNTGTTASNDPSISGIPGGAFSFVPLFSAPSDGIWFNSTSTGAIDLAKSKPGFYEIRYAYSAGGGCDKIAKDTIQIFANPIITPGTIDPFCRSTSGTKTLSLPYTANGSPNQYKIDFDSPSITDIGYTTLPVSPITFSVPADLTAGNYTGKLKVKTANGCESAEYNISFTVNAATEFTIDGASNTCPGSLQTFTYNGTGSPSFTWSVTGGNGETTTNESTYDVTALTSCGSYTVKLDIINADNCASSNTKVVNVVDITPPVIDPLNAYQWEVNAECGATISNTSPTATDNCGLTPDVQLKSESTTTVGCGNSVIKRIWEATDACGNKSTREQVIFLTDNTVPEFTSCQPITVSSLSEVPNPTLKADACSGSSVQIIYQDVSGGANVINRKWTAIDASGNKTSCEQVITISTAPVSPTVKTVSTPKTGQAVTTNAKPTSTRAAATPVKKETQLKAYPNPYTYNVNFTFVPSQTGYAVLDLIDMQGRTVATVFKGNVNAGISKSVTYNNSRGFRVPLIYRLTIGKEVRSGKLMPVSR